VIEMTLAMAETAAKAAMARARDLDTPLTVAVVDEAGRLVLTARGDGAPFFSTDTSRAKAVAAAAFRRPTREMAAAWQAGSPFWGTVSTVLEGQILPSIGAVPIRIGGRVVGAIGCGGAATGEQDHECAEAGARAVEGA